MFAAYLKVTAYFKVTDYFLKASVSNFVSEKQMQIEKAKIHNDEAISEDEL